jgi:hypothetical protein
LFGVGDTPAEVKPYWIQFPRPQTVFVTPALDKLPPLAPGRDKGGHMGALSFTLHSLSGLAARAVRDKRGDAMVWLDTPGNASYCVWRDEMLSATGARRIDAPDGMALVREFADRGVVKGYILYSPDRSERGYYADAPTTQPDYDHSANAATSLSPILGGVIVDEAVEPAFQALGLKRLFDARGRTEEWFFDKYRDQCSSTALCVIDPKVPHCRDYAVASGSLCVFGVTPFTERVLAWAPPNTPIIGWNSGDEYKQTSQFSRWAKFHTASNWCHNLPVLSTVRAGTDVTWDDLNANRRSGVDPLALEWRSDVHYTAFVVTDGDNLQWFMGAFFSNGNAYWNAASRGRFPIGWTAPVDSMSQVAVPVLKHMAATASANDCTMICGGGYYYPDEYGVALGDRDGALSTHLARIGPSMAHLGVRTAQPIAFDWSSSASLAACRIFASEIPGLAGMFPIQYYPYNAGKGEILWTENSRGDPIPVISARYALWAGVKEKLHGTPAAVARFVNEAPHSGAADTAGHFDWTTVHAWSYFREARGSDDPEAEEVDQKLAGQPGVERCVEPMSWCVERLAPHVKVVSPEELAWLVRLHLRPRETLDALARDMHADGKWPSLLREKAQAYRQWLAGAPLETDAQRHEAFHRLADIRFGRIRAVKDIIY